MDSENTKSVASLRFNVLSFVPVVLLFLYGCSSIVSPQYAQPNPVSSVKFTGTIDRAFELSRNALIANGISPTAGSPELGYVSGERGPSLWSWGEIAAIYFKETKPGDILLWVVSKPKLVTNVTAPDWTGNLLAALQFQINRVEQSRADSSRGRIVPSESTGTGFAISPNGIFVTAYHVVENATDIQVRLPSGRWLPAKAIKHSRTTDIAILKADVTASAHLYLADMRQVKQGQRVFTLGYPVPGVLGEEVKYTEGVISSLSGLQGEDSLMQITVPVQPGNSGGPLVNEAGEVVGVVTSSAAISAFLKLTGTLPQNVNWAVKGSYILTILSDKLELETRSQPPDIVEMVKSAVVFIKSK